LRTDIKNSLERLRTGLVDVKFTAPNGMTDTITGRELPQLSITNEKTQSIIEVACKARIGTLDAPNLSSASFFGFFRSFVIDEPITLYDVQSRAVWRAVHVDH
jgi:hypothetical protein